MATTPTDGAQGGAPRLPLFYKDLRPLSLEEHGDWGVQTRETLEFTRGIHAVPITTDEFPQAHRHYPIIFTTNDEMATPLALLGLKEGENLYLDENGKWRQDIYIPAYIRRYPFMLARLSPESEQFSLCFDPTSGELGPEFEQKFFDNGQQTQTTQNVLQFCEEYEKSIARTTAFARELKEHDLLMDGEVAIQPQGADKPAVYRGFKMVSEEKVRELRGDQARKLIQNGALPLIYAHLMSVSIIREVFMRANPPAQAAAEAPVTDVETPGS